MKRMLRRMVRSLLYLLLVAILPFYVYRKRDDSGCKESMLYPRTLNLEFEMRLDSGGGYDKAKNSSAVGRSFNCSEVKLLQQLHLTRDHSLKLTSSGKSSVEERLHYMIVTATDRQFYPSTRVLISSIQKSFPPPENFTYRILLYDMNGEISADASRLHEMESVCRLELRVFNFTNWLPSELHKRRSFAWKPLAVAEAFKELDMQREMLIYADSSIQFESVGDFPELFEMMGEANGKLTPVQLGGWSRTSISFATHPTMYTYLPTDPAIRGGTMWEANLLLIRKTEESRRLLKWAVLCARTKECIDPEGAEITCPMEGLDGVCHRQDQSIFNILVGNMEAEWWAQKQKGNRNEFYARMLPENKRMLSGKDGSQHPMNDGRDQYNLNNGQGKPKNRFVVNRGQSDPLTVIGNCAEQTETVYDKQ